MSTQYRLVQSGKTASGGCSAGPRFVRACSATDLFIYFLIREIHATNTSKMHFKHVTLLRHISLKTFTEELVPGN
jgi:hypothetical protein